MARRSPVVQPSAAHVRAAMFGIDMPGALVARQAWRVTDDDSDELVVIGAQQNWWVARRESDQLTVWAYAGEPEAEDGFEQLLAADRAKGRAWTESAA